MSQISEAERKFIEGGAEQGVRADGRAALDVRPVTLECSVLPNASGSARVRIGKVTDILVGVKAEVAEPGEEAPDEGLLLFSVECSSLASPDFEGRGAADLNAELSRLLARLYASPAAKRLRQGLCLIEGQKCWVLHVDALVLDSGGNLFGALSLAVRAALRLTILPAVTVIPGEADDDDDIEVDEDAFSLVTHSEDAPVAVTLSAIGASRTHLVDCTSEEELCAKFAVTVGVNRARRVCGVVSGGSRGVDMDSLNTMLRKAVSIGVDILNKTDEFLKEDIEKRLTEETPQAIGFFS